jgi:hypothetical protein
MAIKLGIHGSESTLPTTVAVSLPIAVGRNIERRIMSDGSKRWGFFDTGRRTWQLVWTKLTKAQIDALAVIVNYNQTLSFINEDEALGDDFTVVVTSFAYDVINPSGSPIYYRAQMQIEET